MMAQEEKKKPNMSTLAAACSDQINILCFVLTPDYKMISQRVCLLLTLHLPRGVIDTRCDMLLGLCELSTTLKHTHTHTYSLLLTVTLGILYLL